MKNKLNKLGKENWICPEIYLPILKEDKDHIKLCGKFSDKDWWNFLMGTIIDIENDLDFGFKICRRVVEIYIDSTKEIIIRKKESTKMESIKQILIEFFENHI